MSNSGLGKTAKAYYNLETSYSKLFGGSFVRYGAYLGDLEAIGGNSKIDLANIKNKYSELRQGVKQRIVSTKKYLANKQATINGIKILYPMQLDNYLFPLEPFVTSVSGTNSIVITALAGGKGEVIEDMGFNSDRFQVQSILVSNVLEERGEYPEQEVKDFLALCKSRKALKCKNIYLDYMGISEIVITDWSLVNERGDQNFQAIEFNCIADSKTELKLTKLNNITS